MILFYTARQRFDAYLLADRLKQVGIRAHVFNEHASSIVGEGASADHVAQPQVWLERELDLERARIVLAAIDLDARKTGSLHCAGCGEESPASFELCWNCGDGL